MKNPMNRPCSPKGNLTGAHSLGGSPGFWIPGLLLLAVVGIAAFFLMLRPAPPSGHTGTAAAGFGPRMAVALQPHQSVAGQPLSPAPAVRLTDARGLPVAGSVVVAGLLDGSFAAGSLAEVTTDGEGNAVFDSLSVTKAGAYRLVFATPGCDNVQSAEFVVRFGVPRVLEVVREPLGGAAGAPVSGQPAVRVTDASGNPVPGINVDALLDTGSSAAAKVASAPTDAAGLAVFPDIVINSPGAGYRLKFDARAAGVNDAVSAPFNLTNS
jgi:hypothetical protein